MLHAGGGAFITAATVAALGHGVSQISVLPVAPFDSIVARNMAAQGVDARLCVTADPGTDPQITVVIGTRDDRAFLTRASGQALPPLEPAMFANARHLHIGELSTLRDNPALIDHARAARLTISLDCGWQDLFSPESAPLIAQVDVFLPNASEAEALAAAGVPDDCASLTVVKCGSNGARARVRGGDWQSLPARPVSVVDATGAGDAFNGGFVSDWLHGMPLLQCLATGNTCGAAAVQKIGGTGGADQLRASLRKAI